MESMYDDPTTDSRSSAPALGRYEVVRKLGEGGMGAVFLARDSQLDRFVAVKVLPAQSVGDPEAVARFQREARALAKLAHPNIIQAYDSGHEGDKHFLVMEYAEGRSLSDLLVENGPLSPGRAADVIQQTAQALAHAHAAGLIHRDIKPANLLLTAQGQVKILDLGLARFLQDQVADPSRTREGVGMGTPDYAAPEQFHDARGANVRSDIYSLGCTLYRLLTGKVPFPGSSLSEKYEAHRTQEPTPVEELCPDVPAGLALVVRKMMAKRPADRFSSASEVAEALSPYVASSSASFQTFKKTTTWERGQLTTPTMRPRRRFPWISAAIAALSLLVAATTIVVAWNQQRPTEKMADLDATGQKSQEKEQPKEEEKKDPPKTEVKEDPNVLTVSKKGKAQYQTITAALENARSGMTIQVLDDSTYEEVLLFNSRSRHKDITLEAVRKAKIHTRTSRNLIEVRSVPGVTLRGFQLGGPGLQKCVLMFSGDCSGCVLDRLECTNPDTSFAAIEINDQLEPNEANLPILMRGCTIRNATRGVVVYGGNDAQPIWAGNLLLVNNSITSTEHGIQLMGDVRRVCICGNRIWGISRSGIQLEHLGAKSDTILFANNTTFDCPDGLRIWDTAPHGKNVRLCNNLFLESQKGDMTFFNSGGKRDFPKGPGDGVALNKAWKFHDNWREHKPSLSKDIWTLSWVPKADNDILLEAIKGINRDPKSTDFLRPDKGSDLATKGAGNADPSLPRYIGALPPVGEKEWDWNITWKALIEKSSSK